MTFPDDPREPSCLERSKADQCGDCADRAHCRAWLERQVQRVNDGASVEEVTTEIWRLL